MKETYIDIKNLTLDKYYEIALSMDFYKTLPKDIPTVTDLTIEQNSGYIFR